MTPQFLVLSILGLVACGILAEYLGVQVKAIEAATLGLLAILGAMMARITSKVDRQSGQMETVVKQSNHLLDELRAERDIAVEENVELKSDRRDEATRKELES